MTSPGMSLRDQWAHLSFVHLKLRRQQKDLSGTISPPVATRPLAHWSRDCWNLGRIRSPGVLGVRVVTRSVSSTKTEAQQAQLPFRDSQGEECAVSGPSHHVEEDGADECPESQAKAVPLTCAHQWDRKISAGGGRTARSQWRCGEWIVGRW